MISLRGRWRSWLTRMQCRADKPSTPNIKGTAGSVEARPCIEVRYATVYAALGDKVEALSRLEQAYVEHSFFLDNVKVDPELDNLRSEPRFQDLVRAA